MKIQYIKVNVKDNKIDMNDLKAKLKRLDFKIIKKGDK